MNTLIELTHTITLLFSLTFVYGLLIPRTNQLHPAIKNIVQGISFSLFGLLAMANSIPVGNGFIIDERLVIVAISGIFAGGIPTTIATLIMSGYRLMLGGAGAMPGIASLLGAAAISLFLFRHQEPFTSPQFVSRLFGLGIINALQGLLWIALLGGEQSSQILAQIAFPLLLFTSLGTVLLGSTLFYQKRQFTVESALRESEQRYRVVVTNMTEGIILHNSAGEISTCNTAAKSILGLTLEQMTGHTSLAAGWYAVHEDDSPFNDDAYPPIMLIHHVNTQSTIIGIHKPDGKMTWVALHSQPLFNEGSLTPYMTLTTFTDVTQLRGAREKLRQERDLLRTLIDNMPDYIFLKDSDGRFILTNTAHAQAAGNIQPDELIGKTAFDVFSPELATQFHADDQKIMRSRKPLINAERETVDAQGNRKNVLTTKIPWQDNNGQVLGLVGISRDVTERKTLEAQTMALAAEQQRVRVLQRFIMNMSHDFRTPLSVINSSTYLLRKITDPEKREEKMTNIEQQSDRVLKLLDDLLEMAHLDETSVRFQITKEVINPLIQTIVNNFQSAAAIKQQTLEFIPDPLLPISYIDAMKFSRAIINLIHNAINYTPKTGKITLRTYVEANQVVASIADNGIGIAEDDLPHIFERFYRVDSARTATTGGLGLGLPITKTIIEAIRGSISVESTLGKGTTFLIKLPLDAPDAEKTA